jgi:RNA polymerase sigma-70 factor (ECF subfamily)
VVFRTDAGRLMAAARPPVKGAPAVAEMVLSRGTRFAPLARPAIVNGAAGVYLPSPRGATAVVGFTFSEGRIVEIDLILDPEKLRGLSLT